MDEGVPPERDQEDVIETIMGDAWTHISHAILAADSPYHSRRHGRRCNCYRERDRLLDEFDHRYFELEEQTNTDDMLVYLASMQQLVAEEAQARRQQYGNDDMFAAAWDSVRRGLGNQLVITTGASVAAEAEALLEDR